MKTIQEALDYEIKSHWLALYISFNWGQEIIAWWISNKVKRKWNRYKKSEEKRRKIINNWLRPNCDKCKTGKLKSSFLDMQFDKMVYECDNCKTEWI